MKRRVRNTNLIILENNDSQKQSSLNKKEIRMTILISNYQSLSLIPLSRGLGKDCTVIN